ncbi:MAG: DUF6282 family protein [Chloroflexi bacterium]|nr:DUF6282 family protein [Chloroflexota bacterium]
MPTPYRAETLSELRDETRELLRGAIDAHAHWSPDPYAERKMDARELVHAAREAGMAGVVLKSHELPSQILAWALQPEVPGTRLYGAIALDHAVGGLNPDALDAALRIGTSVVWFPTFDTAWSHDHLGRWNARAEAMTVLDEAGALKPVVHDLLDLIVQYGATLCSGHLSPAETLALVRESRRRDIRSIVSHATPFGIPLEVQTEVAALGAFVEQAGTNSFREDGDAAAAAMIADVRAVGPEHVILSTDLGQAPNPPVPAGFGSWMERFLDAGFTNAEVKRMVQTNPAAALGQ